MLSKILFALVTMTFMQSAHAWSELPVVTAPDSQPVAPLYHTLIATTPSDSDVLYEEIFLIDRGHSLEIHRKTASMFLTVPEKVSRAVFKISRRELQTYVIYDVDSICPKDQALLGKRLSIKRLLEGRLTTIEGLIARPLYFMLANQHNTNVFEEMQSQPSTCF